jgi:hypothetical protein
MTQHDSHRETQGMINIAENNSQRLTRLETTMESVSSELSDIRIGLKGIQESLGRSRETNWSVIFSGLAIIGALYAASIRPLENDINRQDRKAMELAEAVKLKDVLIQALRTDTSGLDLRVEALQEACKEMKEHGTPTVDKRLAIIESKLKVEQP